MRLNVKNGRNTVKIILSRKEYQAFDEALACALSGDPEKQDEALGFESMLRRVWYKLTYCGRPDMVCHHDFFHREVSLLPAQVVTPPAPKVWEVGKGYREVGVGGNMDTFQVDYVYPSGTAVVTRKGGYHNIISSQLRDSYVETTG